MNIKNINNYNTVEVAKRLGVSTQSIRNYCRSGKIKYIDISSSESDKPIYEFTDEQINEFLDKYHWDMESGRYKLLDNVKCYKKPVNIINLSSKDEILSSKVLYNNEINIELQKENDKLKNDNIKLIENNKRLEELLKRERIKTREFINNVINLLIPLDDFNKE